MSYKKTFFYKNNGPKEGETQHLDEMIRNNADENPNFFFLVTEELNMRLFISGIIGKDNRKTSNIFTSAPTASSNFILESSQDSSDGKFYIEAYYNDQ